MTMKYAHLPRFQVARYTLQFARIQYTNSNSSCRALFRTGTGYLGTNISYIDSIEHRANRFGSAGPLILLVVPVASALSKNKTKINIIIMALNSNYKYDYK